MLTYQIVVKSLSFELSTGSAGYTSCTIVEDDFLHPYMFYLNKRNGPSLLIQSTLYEAGYRHEVGSLIIRETDELISGIDFALSDSYSNSVMFEKLIDEDEGFRVERGLIISTLDGNEIIVSAAAAPYTIHVISDFYEDRFEPEGVIAEQRRIPWSS